jgi:hypothetical protein
MTKSEVIQLRTICWITVTGFTALSAWFAWGTHQMFAQSAQSRELSLICGNSVTDPLGAILSFGTPVVFSAVAGLAVLSRRGFASRWSVACAALLPLGCAAALVVFGIRLFREALPGFHLSDIVWWLKPLGRVFGV